LPLRLTETNGEESEVPDLEYHRDGAVATILLNRPERKNAFTLPMIDDWVAALESARDDDEIHVIVLRGAGDAFCAGVDLGRVTGEMGTDPLEMKELLRLRVQRIPLVLSDLDKPIIASISGPAVGAGLDMALMCDMRLAARSARLCESYIRVGFVPGAGGLWYLPRLVGIGKAFEIFMTGDFYSAEESERIGMVNRVYDDEQLLDETYALAERIAAAPRVSVGMIKRALYQSANIDLRTSLDLASSHMGIIRSTSDSVRAFTTIRERVGGERPIQ
jgi:enoyl-CoA hydratase/carnithine racemase